ncbi:hypothetical protein QJS04_geneDACA010618 [Acorus gramineus]|uniref:Prolamin-like domain-containing protein n=1 Tax=Acorus gramineus TaxID=55184 RepID=A0AAV9AM31_ACOGR|nr:hypothetical protein QJS04_geneDACA010618 [Acorus gramineus]
MAMKAITLLLLLLLAATAVSAQSASAPAPAPEGVDQDQVKECFKTLSAVGGCVDDIFKSFLTPDFGVAATCCEAVVTVTDECWAKIFFGTYDQAFVEKLRSFCKSLGVGKN